MVQHALFEGVLHVEARTPRSLVDEGAASTAVPERKAQRVVIMEDEKNFILNESSQTVLDEW